MASISESLTNAPPEVLAALAHIPAIPPPEGITSNLLNPYSRADLQISVTSVILAFAILFFINRVYVKVFLMKKVTWDDGTITLAVLGSVAYYVSCTWGAQKGGFGTHQWDLSIIRAIQNDLLIPSYLIAVLTPLTFLFLKTSFFILYLQLFSQLDWIRVCSWIGLIVTALTYSVLTICVFTFATPARDETWFAHQTSKGMKKTVQLSVPQSIVGLIIDLYILLIPIVSVSLLSMSLKRKLGVLLIFFSGVMACVCSACSIYYRVQLNNTPDTVWALIPVNISTLSEMFVGIICACTPSAAYAARQQNSLYQRLLATVSYGTNLIKSSRSTAKSGDSHTRFGSSYPEPDVMKSTDRKYAQYFSLSDMSSTTTRVDGNTANGVSGDDDGRKILSTRTFDVERQ